MKTFDQVVKWHDQIALKQRGTMVGEEHREMSEALDARIAELTTEVADLKSKLSFANAMNVDQDKTVAGLTAHAEKYRDALNDIQSRVASGYFVDANHLGDIARNTLKDGK